MILPQHVIDKMDPRDRESLGKAGRTTQEITKSIQDREEKELHKDIERFLNILGITFCHARMDKKSGITVGWPDFSFPYRGRFIAWEAKTKTTLSPEQNAVKASLERQGAAYRVITDIAQAKDHLREIDAVENPKPTIR